MLNELKYKDYEEKMDFLKKKGLISTGYSNIWSDGMYKMEINFYPNKIEITNFEKIEHERISN